MKLECYPHQNLPPMCNPNSCFGLNLFDYGVELQ